MSAPKKPKKCPECSHDMVRCDVHGKVKEDGGYWVCPRALQENSPKEFDKPYQRRTHRWATVEEDYKHAKDRRAAAKADTPLFRR